MTFTARGLEGQMSFDGQLLSITRRGLIPFLLHGSGGSKRIPVRQITSVDFRRCGLYHGYLQVTIAGETSNPNTGRTAWEKPQPDALGNVTTKDENAVVFYFLANKAFVELARQLDEVIGRPSDGEYRANVQQGSGQQAPAPDRAPEMSVYERIEQAGKLRDAGHITAADFDAKKAQLLAEL